MFGFLWNFYGNEYKKYIDYKFQKQSKTFGNLNPDKIFYVIRIKYPVTGLMSYINTTIAHFLYAEAKGYIPVVDMKNYPSSYQDKRINRRNVWDYFFVPSVDLKEVYRSKHVILSDGGWTKTSSPAVMCDLLMGGKEQYKDIINKYMKFNETTQTYMSKQFESIWRRCGSDKVLGVIMRGTDLLGRKGHAVQPSMDEWFSIIEAFMEQWNCRFLFVASEEQAKIDRCIKCFGRDRVLYNEALRYDSYNKNIVLGQMKFMRKNDGYYRGLEYLTTIYLLTKCNSLIGTKVGAMSGALGFGGAYENVKVIDMGFYD